MEPVGSALPDFLNRNEALHVLGLAQISIKPVDTTGFFV
ncbi:hypothetical protein HMPREF9413_3823 [Paenibacillus sp. HGF7]|nr:hypothetical protein HMPREF9413_3823 [Paenibacillus sp. HGF7]